MEEGHENDNLQLELFKEIESRLEQEELNSKLQDEYHVLLKKLAEAELHIDQLRLGANVDINKRFILTHHTEQCSTLQQKLETEYKPVWTHTTAPLESKTGEWYVTAARMGHSNRNDRNGSGNSAATTGERNGGTTPAPKSLEPKNSQFYSHQEEGEDDDDEAEEMLLSELQPSDPERTLDSSFHLRLSDSSGSGSPEVLSLSQMSTNWINVRASMESQHLAQLFRIQSLQEKVASLQRKLEASMSSSSLDELCEDLEEVMAAHSELAKQIGTAGEELVSLRKKYKESASKEFAKRRTLLGSEVGISFISLDHHRSHSNY